MPGPSSNTMLVLFACLLSLASAMLPQGCVYRSDGVKSEVAHSEEGLVPMTEGPVLRIYIPGTEVLNIAGSNLLFCDEQLKNVRAELSDDKKSYILYRDDTSLVDSYYRIQLFEAATPTSHGKKLSMLQKRGPVNKRRV